MLSGIEIFKALERKVYNILRRPRWKNFDLVFFYLYITCCYVIELILSYATYQRTIIYVPEKIVIIWFSIHCWHSKILIRLAKSNALANCWNCAFQLHIWFCIISDCLDRLWWFLNRAKPVSSVLLYIVLYIWKLFCWPVTNCLFNINEYKNKRMCYDYQRDISPLIRPWPLVHSLRIRLEPSYGFMIG